MNTRIFALALTLCALPVSAQTSTEPTTPNAATTVVPASSEPKMLEAKEAKVPSRARIGLPRGAQTVFCLQTQLEGKPVLLHGWKPAKSEKTTLDIFAITSTSRPARKTRGKRTRSKRSSTSTLRRLNRVALGEVTSADEGPGVQMNISTTAFDARAKRGLVMVLNWPYHNVSFSYMYVPMIVVTLPTGLSGRAFSGNYTTEIESGGGTVYQPRVDADGRFLLRKKDYARDAGTAHYTPYTWDGKGYEAGTPGPEQPDND